MWYKSQAKTNVRGQGNQFKLSPERKFPGMLRLGPSDPGLAQPTPISHLMEDGENTTTNFSFSWILEYGL